MSQYMRVRHVYWPRLQSEEEARELGAAIADAQRDYNQQLYNAEGCDGEELSRFTRISSILRKAYDYSLRESLRLLRRRK